MDGLYLRNIPDVRSRVIIVYLQETQFPFDACLFLIDTNLLVGGQMESKPEASDHPILSSPATGDDRRATPAGYTVNVLSICARQPKFQIGHARGDVDESECVPLPLS